jgi:hypothetical protein
MQFLKVHLANNTTPVWVNLAGATELLAANNSTTGKWEIHILGSWTSGEWVVDGYENFTTEADAEAALPDVLAAL